MKIAILGGTSHIAKGLIYNFDKRGENELFLFVRSFERTKEFLEETGCSKNVQIREFSDLDNESYDVLINCIGISSAEDIKSKMQTIFKLTENFDNLILDYLKKHPSSLYINFSSGAVFGTKFDQPVDELSQAKWTLNNIGQEDYYGIAKLYSEAKHRSLKNFNIADLRIFGYFSCFIDLKSKYILTEIISCIKGKKVFITNNVDIVRDYLHPDDLFSLLSKCIEKGKLNDVYDAYSLKPITKFEIINYFVERHGLKYEIKEIDSSSATGRKSKYYSNSRKAETLGYFPQYTSMDCIAQEAERILT